MVPKGLKPLWRVPSPAAIPAGHSGQHRSYFITTTFGSPLGHREPRCRDTLQGLLVVTWPGGSALLELSGTTAQITATLLDKEPVEVRPLEVDYYPTIPVKITYFSGDSSNLKVNVGQASPPTPPVNFSVGTVHIRMPPHLHLITVNNPKNAVSHQVSHRSTRAHQDRNCRSVFWRIVLRQGLHPGLRSGHPPARPTAY